MVEQRRIRFQALVSVGDGKSIFFADSVFGYQAVCMHY